MDPAGIGGATAPDIAVTLDDPCIDLCRGDDAASRVQRLGRLLQAHAELLGGQVRVGDRRAHVELLQVVVLFRVQGLRTRAEGGECERGECEETDDFHENLLWVFYRISNAWNCNGSPPTEVGFVYRSPYPQLRGEKFLSNKNLLKRDFSPTACGIRNTKAVFVLENFLTDSFLMRVVMKALQIFYNQKLKTIHQPKNSKSEFLVTNYHQKYRNTIELFLSNDTY